MPDSTEGCEAGPFEGVQGGVEEDEGRIEA